MAGGEDRRWSYVPDELRRRYDEEFGSIPNAVRVTARRHAALEAIVDGEVRMTFAELESARIDAVRGMIALGVRPGTRVGLMAPNCARWIVAALGILGAGGVVVPLNTRFKGPEAAYILRKSGANVLVTVTDFLDNDYLGMIRASDSDLAALNRVVVISGDAAPPVQDWMSFPELGRSIGAGEGQSAVHAVTAN